MMLLVVVYFAGLVIYLSVLCLRPDIIFGPSWKDAEKGILNSQKVFGIPATAIVLVLAYSCIAVAWPFMLVRRILVEWQAFKAR